MVLVAVYAVRSVLECLKMAIFEMAVSAECLSPASRDEGLGVALILTTVSAGCPCLESKDEGVKKALSLVTPCTGASPSWRCKC